MLAGGGVPAGGGVVGALEGGGVPAGGVAGWPEGALAGGVAGAPGVPGVGGWGIMRIGWPFGPIPMPGAAAPACR